MELNSKNIKKILLIILLGSIIFAAVHNLGSLFGFLSIVFSIFAPVITALCIAFILNVPLTFLETKAFKFWKCGKSKILWKLKRPVCLFLTYLFSLGIVAVSILIIIPDIIETLTYIFEKLPSFILEVRVWLTDILKKYDIPQDSIPFYNFDITAFSSTLVNFLSGYSGSIFNNAVSITSSFVSGVFNGIFSLVISVYVLAQKEKIGCFVKKVIDSFVPQKTAKLIFHLSERTSYSFSKFIGGQLTEAVILGILCYIGMIIFRFPNAAIISVLITVTALIPIVGATIGVVIGFLLILITNPLKALLFVLFFLVLQQLEGNLIYPRVVGKAVGLPAVIVISAVLVGGNIGGILGTLIAVPLCAVLYTLLREAIASKHREKSLQIKE